MTCLDDELKKAEPKTIRNRIAPCRGDPRAPRAAPHVAPGRDLALGGNAPAGLLEAADRFPISRLGPGARPDNGESPEGVTSDESTNFWVDDALQRPDTFAVPMQY